MADSAQVPLVQVQVPKSNSASPRWTWGLGLGLGGLERSRPSPPPPAVGLIPKPTYNMTMSYLLNWKLLLKPATERFQKLTRQLATNFSSRKHWHKFTGATLNSKALSRAEIYKTRHFTLNLNIILFIIFRHTLCHTSVSSTYPGQSVRP